jgi:predicted DNA-binding transcriptional regulator AlpA
VKKKQVYNAPERLHLDKRAEVLATVMPPEASGDDLLTTREVAVWFGVSTQWLDIGRIRNYGPPFVMLSPHAVRYRRAEVTAWLNKRAFANTGEYRDRVKAKKAG